VLVPGLGRPDGLRFELRTWRWRACWPDVVVAAASMILPATARAHGTGAAGDRGKVEDLGEVKRR
jgi:hypothetical protein